MKNILVQFDIRAGEYEHRDFYLFKKKQSEYKYCKEFWGLTKKLPKRFLNYKVFNGDKSDLRFNDPKNVIVGLYAKGRALKDQTGVVQDV